MRGVLSTVVVNDEDEESQLLVAFDQETKDVKRIRLILPAGLSVNDLQSTTVDTVEVSERGRRLQFRSMLNHFEGPNCTRNWR